MSSNCRLCKSNKLKLIVKYKDSVPVDNFRERNHSKISLGKFSMDLHICNSCGHVQLINAVDPTLLFGDYIYESSTSPDLKRHFQKLFKKIIKKKILPKNGYVIDIGCNDGLLLENFMENGYKSFGIDPDKKSLKVAKKKGVRVFNDYLNIKLSNDIINKFGKFDLITATNVYSHSDDLIGFTKCISKLLKNDGTYIFEVSYLKALLFSGVWDYVYHEHLAYHSIKPLYTFLKKYGLHLYDVENIPVKGGSIRCYVKKNKPTPVQLQKIKKIIAYENKKGFYKMDSYKRLLSIKSKLTKDLNNKINLSGNKKLASYGASATTTVLSQELDYASKISFIVDDNKNRQNKLSPGYMIPILSFSSLKKFKPDYLIISAWRFKNLILKKCENYIKEGGTIIIPNPKIKIINYKNYFRELKNVR